MRNVLMSIMVVAVLSIVTAGCYDDLGNYDYKEINDMVIEMPRSYSVKIPKSDSTLVVVNPQITQTLQSSNENLHYEWKRRNVNDWEVCCNEAVYSFYIYPDDQSNIQLMLSVTDANQNIVSFQETLIRLVHAYANCWFVLQEVDGQAVLGAVDGQDEVRVVTPDAYKQETGSSLVGKPLFLSINNSHLYGPKDRPSHEPILGIYTTAYCGMVEPSTLAERYSYERMLLGKRNTGFTPQPLFASGELSGECVIDNGEFWFAFGDGHSIYYPVHLDESIGGTYYATMAYMGPRGDGLNFVFDKQNSRFLQYTNSSYGMVWSMHEKIDYDKNYDLYNPEHQYANGERLRLIGENTKSPNVFNPDNIGAGKEVVFMGPTTETEHPKVLAIAREGTSSQLHIYELNTPALVGERRNEAYASGYFTMSVPGMDGKDIPLACSSNFDRLFFYATADRLCRADLNWSSPRSYDILTLEELGLSSSAQIIDMKFCSPGKDFGYLPEGAGENDPFVMYNYPGKLALVVRYDGQDSIFEIELTAAGDVKRNTDKRPVAYEFKGFKNIVDLVYSYR